MRNKNSKIILEVIPQLSSGGAERFIVDLCNELVGKEIVILVVLFPIDSSWFYIKELSPKIRLISLNKAHGFDIILVWKLINLISRVKPDIVHTHLRAFNYVFWSKLFFWKISFFHTVHSDAMIDSGGWLGVLFRKVIFKLKLFKTITISEESQKSFEKLFNVDSFLVPNGRSRPLLVNEDRVLEEICAYRVTENTKLLVNVASIQYLKNQIMLSKCVKKLVEEGYDVVLLIIGRISDEKIKKEIIKIDCDRIHLLGERRFPTTYVHNADAFCLSSRFEGMPITLIECFAVGAIPVCTPVGGIVNVIRDGEMVFFLYLLNMMTTMLL